MKFADVSEEDVQRYSVSSGDILLVRTNGNPDYVGRGAVVSSLKEIWLFASYLLRLRLETERALPNYIHLAIRSEQFRRILRLNVQTSAGNYNLNIQNLSSLPIALPFIAEQKSIVDVIETSFKEIEKLQTHRAKNEQLKFQVVNSLIFNPNTVIPLEGRKGMVCI